MLHGDTVKVFFTQWIVLLTADIEHQKSAGQRIAVASCTRLEILRHGMDGFRGGMSMERLTYDCCFGDIHCWQVKGADNLECRQVCEEQGENGCKGCPIELAFDRLAAYEDTGLTPEEVQQMRWIPVEERLPDKPGHYLVCTNVNYWHGGCMDKNGASSNAGTTDGYAGTTLSVLDCFYDITGDWNRVCNAHVTHWMPLPQPPKEEKK